MNAALAARPESRSSVTTWAVIGAAATILCSIASAIWESYSLVGLLLTSAIAVCLAYRAPHILLGVWIVLTPWASYIVRFPDERSLLTFDRVMVPALVCGFAVHAWKAGRPIARISLFEFAWLCFSILAVLNTVLVAIEKGQALRVSVDAFLLPLLLYAALRRGFEPTRGASVIYASILCLALLLPWLGLAEFVLGRDLMPFKGSSIFRTGIVRANGPFSTDNSYAIISGLVAIALYFFPRAYQIRRSVTTRVLSYLAQSAALLASLIPLFRTIMAALLAGFSAEWLANLRTVRFARAALALGLCTIAALPVLIPLSSTRVFSDRISDPSSVLSRIATYRAAAEIIEDHPIAGVGLMNYHDYFGDKYGTAWYVDVEAVADVGAESYPHNNILGVFAELGLAAVFFYVLAGIAIVANALRRRDFGSLGLLLVYWITGMTLYSGIYSDLNLYYFAFLGLFASVRNGILDMENRSG